MKILMTLLALLAFSPAALRAAEAQVQKIHKSDAEWKKVLTPEQYRILREKGTERAYSGEYDKNKRDGVYECAGCGLPLFDSKDKFESGTGWPSFTRPAVNGHVVESSDDSYGMKRTSIECGRCDGHLGHVFDDGPRPTGLRYCINSVSMKFKKRAS